MIYTILTFIYPTFGLLLIIFYLTKNLKNINDKNLKKLVFPLAFIFGSFGYSLTFGLKENDLTRYYEIINSLNFNSIFDMLNQDNSLLYTQDLLFYFTQKTGNLHILPFIVALIIYAITFYILFDTIERSKYQFKIYQILLLIILSVGIVAPLSIIVNIRTITAYSIIVYAAYRDIIQNKKNLITGLLYVIPLLLHSSAIIILLVRIMAQLLKKIPKISLLIGVMLPTIIDFMYEKVGNIGFGIIGTLINNAVNKAYSYLHWTSGGWATQIENSTSNDIFRITGTIFLIAMIFLVIINKQKLIKDDKENNTNNYTMIMFIYLVATVALGTLSIKTGAFWRFETIVSLFSPIILVPIIKIGYKNQKYCNLLYFFGIIMFLLNIIYQSRNMDVLNTFNNFITTSGIKIFYEIIKGILNFF